MIRTNRDIQVIVKGITKDAESLVSRLRLLEEALNARDSIKPTAATVQKIRKMGDVLELIGDYIVEGGSY